MLIGQTYPPQLNHFAVSFAARRTPRPPIAVKDSVGRRHKKAGVPPKPLKDSVIETVRREIVRTHAMFPVLFQNLLAFTGHRYQIARVALPEAQGLGNDFHGVYAWHSHTTRLNATAFQNKDLCPERLFRVQVHEVLGHGLDCMPLQLSRQVRAGKSFPRTLQQSKFIQEIVTGQQRFVPTLCQQPDVIEAYRNELSQHGGFLKRHLGMARSSYFSLNELNAFDTHFLYGTPQRLKALSQGSKDSFPLSPHNPSGAERIALKVLEFFPNTLSCLRRHRREMLQTLPKPVQPSL